MKRKVRKPLNIGKCGVKIVIHFNCLSVMKARKK